MRKIWQGIEIDTYRVPRSSQPNSRLVAYGLQREEYGEQIRFFEKEPGTHFIQGRISDFGGAHDRGVSKAETAALSGELLRNMNSRSDYYLAMRFDYGRKSEEGREFFRNRKFLIVNPRTMQGVVARAIDWGPHPRTKRVIDASASVLAKLKLRTDDIVWVSFADNSAPLGPVGQLSQL